MEFVYLVSPPTVLWAWMLSDQYISGARPERVDYIAVESLPEGSIRTHYYLMVDEMMVELVPGEGGVLGIYRGLDPYEVKPNAEEIAEAKNRI